MPHAKHLVNVVFRVSVIVFHSESFTLIYPSSHDCFYISCSCRVESQVGLMFVVVFYVAKFAS